MKISVIVPVYNVARYLEKCLNSIVGQSYLDLEIILVNDGSTDNSAEICDAFSKKDDRIIVIHQQNSGVSAARNAGIKRSKGDYITFVDSDDWLSADMYKSMVETIVNNPSVSVVMCDFINEKKGSLENITANIRQGFYDKEMIVKELYDTLFVTEDFGRLPIVSACICLFKNDLFTHHAIVFDAKLKYSEDYLFMAQIMVAADSYYYLKGNYFYHYRQHDESRSKKYQSEWWDNLLRLNKELENAVSEQKDYDFSRQLKLQLIHSALFISSGIENQEGFDFDMKRELLHSIFTDQLLINAFGGLSFSKQSFFQKIVLNLIKYKCTNMYLIYRRFIKKVKKNDI